MGWKRHWRRAGEGQQGVMSLGTDVQKKPDSAGYGH